MLSLLLASAAATALAADDGDHHHSPKLGTLTFQTSCSAPAQAHFLRGLGWLHSFEYDDAARAFAEAASADPSCGIAHWGVATSQYRPLWTAPTAAELAKGRDSIAKARSATLSERERGYVDAIALIYENSDRLDHKTRVQAYSAAMGRLSERFPEDREAAVLHALTLVALGMMDSDPTFSMEKQAAAILNVILAENPDHPGVAHYLIHSFDYPPLAYLAVDAARRYASIAPDSAHAHHMPTHIFTRLGMWGESIQSNLRSAAAAQKMLRAKGMAGASREELHAYDYLAYAYLQSGQDSKAEGVLARLNDVTAVDEPVFSVAYATTAIPARLALERRRWREAAALEIKPNVRNLVPRNAFPWADSHIAFARAVGAARSGDVESARREVAQLKAIEQALVIPAGTYDWQTQVSIARQVAEAWLMYAEGRSDDAMRAMAAAADLDDKTEKHPVTPGSLLPAREQLGELLAEAGRPVEALAAFEDSLRRAPNRLVSLYGAARAARKAGDSAKAGSYFSKLAEITRDGEGARSEVREARAYVAKLAAR